MVWTPTSFSIPSIHDGISLECRLQHPDKSSSLSTSNHKQNESKPTKGVILGHPYAPLGGNFDDPVLASASKEFLRQGFIVGTFNFRGAGASEGRTTWTAKGEIDDYISFAGVFIYYLHHLRGARLERPIGAEEDACSTSIPDSGIATNNSKDLSPIILVLGGYSYGSMITDLLPDIESIIKRFSSPRTGSIEAEIRSRAWHLARSSISDTSRCEEMDDSGVGKNSFSSTRTNQHVPSPTSGTGTGSSPKKSLERRFRKSLDIVRTKVLLRRSLDEGVEPASSSGSNEGNPLEKSIRTHYLLISPLLPPISSLATFFSNTPSTTRSSKDENADDASSSSSSSKLVRSPTLAIYGDRDIFTSYKKLQKWASELAKQPHSRFRCCEVQGAGHFWVEEGVERRLRGAVREWITLSVLRPSLAQADET